MDFADLGTMGRCSCIVCDFGCDFAGLNDLEWMLVVILVISMIWNGFWL